MQQFQYHFTLYKQTLTTIHYAIEHRRQNFKYLIAILKRETNDLVRNINSIEKGTDNFKDNVWPKIEHFVEISHNYLYHQEFNKSNLAMVARYNM